jgi:DNA-binding Lrp family transcriptional regulator
MTITEIDRVDKKILYALDALEAYTLNDVASFANLSKQSLNYRINKLMEMDVLQGYSVELNLSKLGILLGRLYLKFSGSRTKHVDRLAKLFKKRPLYFWSATGEYDAFLAFDVSKDGKAISALLNDEFSGSILRSRFAVFSDVISLDRAYLLGKHPSKSWHFINSTEKPVRLSETTLKLLPNILDNASSKELPFKISGISEASGMDFRTVKRAVLELSKEGVIQRIKPIINTHEIGINHYKVDVRLSSKADHKTIKDMEKDLYWAVGSIYINKTIGPEPSIEGEFESSPAGFDDFIEKFEEKYSDEIGEIRQMIYRQQLITTSFVSVPQALRA